MRIKSTMLAALSAASMLAVATPAHAVVVISGSGSITKTDSTQTDRVFRNEVASTWAAMKSFPGTFSQTPTYYDLLNATFASNSMQTIYYEITYASNTSFGGSVFSVAYQNSFNPANLATNYLGDGGRSVVDGSSQTYQVVVAAGNQLLLNFQDVGGYPVNYTYTVSAYSDSSRSQNFLPTGAVPEPASWAMMILGMGAVGCAMRRRNKVTTRVSYVA